jgi:hypothetical protein
LNLQISRAKNLVMSPLVPAKNTRGTINMTNSTDIMYQRRVRLLESASDTDNITEAYPQMSISWIRYYHWQNIADDAVICGGASSVKQIVEDLGV